MSNQYGNHVVAGAFVGVPLTELYTSSAHWPAMNVAGNPAVAVAGLVTAQVTTPVAFLKHTRRRSPSAVGAASVAVNAPAALFPDSYVDAMPAAIVSEAVPVLTARAPDAVRRADVTRVPDRVITSVEGVRPPVTLILSPLMPI